AVNETRVHFIGPQVTLPLPVLNTRRGEIQQRQAELERAALELRQAEVQVQQDVRAALARLRGAYARVTTYRTTILPDLRASLKAIERLFAQGEPGVDVLRVLDIRRKLLRAQDGYIDALWEVRQGWADLATAVGDPALAVVQCLPLPPLSGPLP